MPQPGDRALSPDAIGTHFSAHSSRLGLSPAPHGALLGDLGVDGVRESVWIRGNGARILQVPADHAHGVDEADLVQILQGLSGRPVDQAPHGVMREHQLVDLLEDQIRGLAPQRGSRSGLLLLERFSLSLTHYTHPVSVESPTEIGEFSD